MKRLVVALAIGGLLLGTGWLAWRSALSTPTDSSAAPTGASNSSPAAASSPGAPLIRRPAPALLAGNPATAMAELPEGELRRGLASLPETVRVPALQHLAELRVPFQDHGSLRVDLEGRFFYICSVPAGLTSGEQANLPESDELEAMKAAPSAAVAAASVPITQPPVRHSRPGASRVAYLDFNGHTVTGTSWNSLYGVASFVTRPYDTDGSPTTFSDAEQAAILRIWARVAEDFAAFDIDITTEEPAVFTAQTARILITRSVDANGVTNPEGSRAGGVAFLDVFGRDSYATTSPAFVYFNNLSNDANVAEAASHELGHNLALAHDGTTTLAYYGGHGTGETSWGPIMGTGYGRNISQWSKGEYLKANNTQDDLAILAARLTYRPDDTGDTASTARALSVDGTAVSGSGLIERATDADRFSFSTAGGTVSLTARPLRVESGTLGGNLDLILELYDAAETLVASANPTATLSATLSTTVAAGDYTLRVSATGVGNPRTDPPTGYTVYGSAGSYTITGSVPPAIEPEVPTLITPPRATTVVVGSTATFTVIARGATPLTYQWRKGETLLAGQTTATLTLPAAQTSDEGLYSVTVSNALGSTTSLHVALTVVPAPLAPAILRQPANQIATTGALTALTVEAAGSAPLAYQWRRNGVTIPGANSSVLNFPSVTPTDAGSYSVVVSNPAGTATSQAATLTVYALPIFSRHPVSRTVVPGATAAFSAEVSALPTATLRWQRSTDDGINWTDLTDGSGVSGATTGTLSLAALTTGSSGFRFRAVATNSVGAIPSDPAVLTVAVQPPVTAIAASTEHSLFLKADGSVWATGSNDAGVFGDDSTGVFATPVQVASGATAIAVGYAHSLMLKADGTLWATGVNNSGQLGDGTFTDRSVWVQVATDVSAIAARGYESAFIRRDGSLWVMGRNRDGQLGDGTLLPRSQPAKIASGVRSVSLGYLHMLFVDSAGNLHAAGANSEGQLGDSSLTSRTTPVAVATGVTQAVAGYQFSAFLRTDGTVWGMGQNQIGQMGDGVSERRPSPVAIGSQRTRLHANFNHLLAYDGATAQLFGSGGNLFGQIDASGLFSRPSSTLVTSSVAVAEAGYFTSHWVKTDGSTWAVGRNLSGQLGDGSTTDRLTPVEIFAGVPAPAGTPSGFSATDGASAAATRLTWTHLPGGPRYEVWRHTANNSAAATRLVSDEIANFFEDRSGTPGVTYFYWVRAVGPGGPGAFSAPDTGFRVAQGTPPAFVTPPVNTVVIAGTNATFTVAVSGDPRPTLQWQLSSDNGASWTDLLNGSVYQGTTTDQLQVIAVPANFSGYRYRAIADNSAGRAISQAATLNVNAAPQPPAITSQPTTVYANENTAATFTVSANGAGPISYQWRRNGVALSGAVNAILTLPAVQFADAGTYDVVVSNGAGSTISASASLIVTTPGLISPEKSVLRSRAQSYAVSVNTSGPWAVTESLPWVSVSPATGTGRSSVTVTVTENTSSTTRTGMVLVNGVAHTIMQLAPTGLDQWTWRNPLPHGYELRRVLWDGTEFLAVGEGGAILTSPDGATWTARGSETTFFYGLTRGAGLYVAVGDLGRIRTSVDKITWTSRTSGVGLRLHSVAWNGSTFVAVGIGGTILTSPDGITWTARTSGRTTTLRQVVWGAGQFLVVGDAGVILSSPDGVTWTARTSGTTDNLFCSVHNGTQWVAAGALGVVLTSPDGVTWTIRNSGGTFFVQELQWDGTAFIAVASQGRILTSLDGVTWTTTSTPTAMQLQSIAWNGQRYVVVGDGGVVLNGINRTGWSLANGVTSRSLRDVIWNGRMFVGVGDTGTIVTSIDGATWTANPTDASRFLTSIAWSGTRFVVVGNSGLILTSPDGLTWTPSTSPTTSQLTAVTWTGSRFVVVGYGNKVLTSADGLTWTLQGTGITDFVYDIVWNGEIYVAVGNRGKIFTSPDALTWTERISPATSGLASIAWSGSMFVAVGYNGDAASSPDGITWTKVPLTSGVSLETIKWNGTTFIGMGTFGYTIVSPDGENWTTQIIPVPGGVSIFGLAWTADRFVAVGSNGIILQATDQTASQSPQIELHPLPQTAPVASTVSFRVVARGLPAPRYQWYKNATPLAGATADNLTLRDVTSADAGTYSVVASNTAGSTTSVGAALTIVSGYSVWQQENFEPAETTNSSVSGPLADPDADGLSNLLEYALGSAPKSPSSLPQVAASGSELVFTYSRPSSRPNLRYEVEVSSTLTNWTLAGVIHERVSSAADVEVWQARTTLSSTAPVFFRLKVTSL